MQNENNCSSSSEEEEIEDDPTVELVKTKPQVTLDSFDIQPGTLETYKTLTSGSDDIRVTPDTPLLT